MSYIDETYGKQLEEALRSLVSRPALGQPWFGFHESEVPAGVLLFTATTHSRVLYADFWKYIKDKNLVKTEEEWQTIHSEQGWCPFYSDGDGIDTFRMPSAPLYLRGADTLSEAGKYVQEGLPNISGEVFNFTGYGSDWGPYTNSKYGNAFIAGLDANVGGNLYYINDTSIANGVNTDGFILDASRCSPVYGNSFHVTPETSKILFGVWAISVPQQPIPDATVEGIVSELSVVSSNALEAKNGLNGVVRSVNGMNADAAGNVSDVSEIGNNFVRFTNGLQICWGDVVIPSGKNYSSWAYPKAFSGNPRVVSQVFGTSNTSALPDMVTAMYNNSSTSIGLKTNKTIQTTIHLLAVGRWK